MSRTPDFILIGAMKCGTTSLQQNLSTHEEVYMLSEEPRFFHSERYHKQGLEQYISLFGGRDEAVVGESSGFYAWDSCCEETAERIGKDVPEAKIIYIVRHPVERIESHWAWEIANGQPWGSINEAVQEVGRLVEMSLYWRQLSQYRMHFDDDQIKVLFLEDLKADPRAFFGECGQFLGVDPDKFDFEEAATPKNRTADKRTDTRLIRRLRQWSGFWSLKEILPNSFIRLGKQVLRRDGKIEPKWDEAMLRNVEEKLAPDVVRILEYCGRPRNLWPFRTLSLEDVETDMSV